MKLSATTHTADETHALGRRVGALLRAGDVVVLDGELGTGKTVFAKGIAIALGISEPVVSPTFTVVREYDAPTPLVHVDVYRLDHLQELHDLGFDDLVGSDAVTVVEWGEGKVEGLSPDRLQVHIAWAGAGPAADDHVGEEPRRVGFRPTGARWAAVDVSSLARLA